MAGNVPLGMGGAAMTKPVLHYLVSRNGGWVTACNRPVGSEPQDATINPVTFALDTAPDAEFVACPGCEAHLNGVEK